MSAAHVFTADDMPVPVEDSIVEPNCPGDCEQPVTQCACYWAGQRKALKDHEPPEVTDAWFAGIERGVEEMTEWLSGLRDEYGNSGHDLVVGDKLLAELAKWPSRISEHVKQEEDDDAG